MNIEQSTLREIEEVRSPIERLYQTIPRSRDIVAAVRAGEAEFQDFLAKAGLLERGASTSSVHPDDDIALHAFVLGIVSEDRWDEIQTKSFLTYASHWIDDFFDSPDKVEDPDQLLRDRRDIRRALANMGPVGTLGFAMAGRVPHPEAIYKTLHRMLYGGLVQRSHDHAERQQLVREYLDVATRFVDPRMVEAIRKLQPEAYWTTNKSVLEISNAAERELDFNTAELWNLVYAPALYYQDAEEERARGELSFEEDDEPRLPEMVRMIRLGARELARVYAPGSPQMSQIDFVARSFANLPAEVVREYRSLLEGRQSANDSSLWSSRSSESWSL
ncbi:MAG: hypothetical protein WBE69_19050 [Candidatus Binataceae bacterium]